MPLPEFNPGTLWPDLRAEDMRALVDLARSVSEMRGDGLVLVDRSQGRLSLKLNLEEIGARIGKGPRRYTAMVTASSAANSAPITMWNYTCSRVRKTGTGYGSSKWTTYGDSFAAYNACENINSHAEGVQQGNGIDLAHLDIDGDTTDDFAFYPIQNNTLVLVEEVPVEGEAVEYWIVGAGYMNGVDGTCP